MVRKMQRGTATLGLAKAMGEALQQSSWATFTRETWGPPSSGFPIKFFRDLFNLIGRKRSWRVLNPVRGIRTFILQGYTIAELNCPS